MRCSDCKYWFRGTRKQYKNKLPIFIPSADNGNGVCRSGGMINGTVVGPTFGCIDFLLSASLVDDQEDSFSYDQEPWQVWEMIPCPDCLGVGSERDSACHRCVGTGNVRKYADGFVGEERTREHPVEKEMRLEKQRQDLMAKMRAELEELERVSELAQQDPKNTSGAVLSGGSGPV
jgi:hypothetical protein